MEGKSHCLQWCDAGFVGGWSSLLPSVTVSQQISPAVPVFYLISAWVSRFRWLPHGWVRKWTRCRWTVTFPCVVHYVSITSLVKSWWAAVHKLHHRFDWLRLKWRWRNWSLREIFNHWITLVGTVLRTLLLTYSYYNYLHIKFLFHLV